MPYFEKLKGKVILRIRKGKALLFLLRCFVGYASMENEVDYFLLNTAITLARGHGKSSYRKGMYLQRFWKDAKALLDYLNITTVIVGLSMGGTYCNAISYGMPYAGRMPYFNRAHLAKTALICMSGICAGQSNLFKAYAYELDCVEYGDCVRNQPTTKKNT